MENLLMLRRRMAVAKGSDKPYDAEVEFLESSGTQYIDLGMPLQYTDEMYIDVQGVGSADGGAYGAYQASPLCYANITTSGTNANINARYFTSSFYVTNKRAELTNDSTTLYYRAKGAATYSTKALAANVQMTVNFYLFAFNNNGSAKCGGAKIYSFSVTRNGVLLLDMIPVRVGTTGYMYDKVSGQLFGNDGSGDFTLGNDL